MGLRTRTSNANKIFLELTKFHSHKRLLTLLQTHIYLQIAYHNSCGRGKIISRYLNVLSVWVGSKHSTQSEYTLD